MDKITVKINDTPSGKLLARALEIIAATGCTMGDAMDQATAERDAGTMQTTGRIMIASIG